MSPASTPDREVVEDTVRHLESMGLRVELGEHVFDKVAYLAGTDEARLEDFNRALRDSDTKALIATAGGKGAYRIAERIDLAAVQAQPKLLVGFSEITILHLVVQGPCGVCSIHGAAWPPAFSERSAGSFVSAAFSQDEVLIGCDPAEPTAALTTSGQARGRLIGGNQEMIATAAGWALPSLDGAILLLEGVGLGLGQMDRQLTMLEQSGHLTGVRGVAVGQYTNCGPAEAMPGEWTCVDVLRDRLDRLGVPILGGLPIGHGESPLAVPLGSLATLDADAGRLIVDPAVD